MAVKLTYQQLAEGGGGTKPMTKSLDKKRTLIINIESSRYISPKPLYGRFDKLVAWVLIVLVGFLAFYATIKLGE